MIPSEIIDNVSAVRLELLNAGAGTGTGASASASASAGQ